MLEIIEENPLESEENMGKGQEKAGQKSYVKGKKQEEEPQKELISFAMGLNLPIIHSTRRIGMDKIRNPTTTITHKIKRII